MKILLTILLAISLYADSCWDTYNNEWIEFLFIEEVKELETNAVDKDLRPLFVYQAEGVTVDYDSQELEYMYYCERKDIK
jgi:hypothetical protein